MAQTTWYKVLCQKLVVKIKNELPLKSEKYKKVAFNSW
jgi:hypothetical protein